MAGYTEAQLEALEAAIASGTLSVRHGDKAVQYQSLEQMQALRDRMRGELGKNTHPRPATSRAIFSWGE